MSYKSKINGDNNKPKNTPERMREIHFQHGMSPMALYNQENA